MLDLRSCDVRTQVVRFVSFQRGSTVVGQETGMINGVISFSLWSDVVRRLVFANIFGSVIIVCVCVCVWSSCFNPS